MDQDLVCEHGYTGSYDAVKRFARQWCQTQPVPFVRMEVAAGQEVQVDFGQRAWVWANGRRKRPHLFRIVLAEVGGALEVGSHHRFRRLRHAQPPLLVQRGKGNYDVTNAMQA
jgi:hypothetical protein